MKLIMKQNLLSAGVRVLPNASIETKFCCLHKIELENEFSNIIESKESISTEIKIKII